MVNIDNVIKEKNRVKREFCSYYTDSDPILTYMISRLNIENGDNILEPCAGDGVFLEKIITSSQNIDYKIDALDLNPRAINKLRSHFSNANINIRKADTLTDSKLDTYAKDKGYYSKIIGNPPYGAWQTAEKKKILKERYNGYVKETYTLFIERGIDLLKEEGRLVFIVPDTFLALHVHKKIRKKILKTVRIEEIILIPSNFFPGVNFGYSNLCIISVQKNDGIKDNIFKIISINRKVEDLYEIAKSKYSLAESIEEIKQIDVLNSLDYSFFIGGNAKIRRLINKSKINLGDLAHCVTGFCSGENLKFYKPLNKEVKNCKKYDPVSNNEIDFNYLNQNDLLNGLKNNKKYIPMVKSGQAQFNRISDWFVRWDKETVLFYKNNKKSRFQNAKFYFKEGIGVPMVSSKKLKAFLLKKRIFDQSIVGIFPKDKNNLYYLLAFLNSDICNNILKTINHTANNSANYLKKIPVIIDPVYFDEISNIVGKILSQDDELNLEVYIKRINNIFNIIYSE